MATETTARRRFTAADILLGLGLGGFVDGIVLHHLFQWHHMLTDYGGHASFPATTASSLEENTFWDGLFHASTWVSVTVGLFLLWQALSAGGEPSRCRCPEFECALFGLPVDGRWVPHGRSFKRWSRLSAMSSSWSATACE
jgi:Predicted membrane protein (DUF2243)